MALALTVSPSRGRKVTGNHVELIFVMPEKLFKKMESAKSVKLIHEPLRMEDLVLQKPVMTTKY